MKTEMMMNGGGGGGENAIKLNHHQQSTNQLLVVPAGNDGQPPPENGSLSCSSSTNSENGHNSNANGLNKPDLDYLGQLLKDKKQLAAFPNVFSHLERLVDDEINRVRIAIFQCEFSREPLQLPETIGEVNIQQEKVFVPTKQFPDYNFVGRILGPRGMTAKQLEAETGCKIMVRGRGSMRDKKKEDMNRGKPNWEHLSEELHVIIQSEDTPNRNAVKIARAVEEVNKLLVPQPEGEDELKRKQLMELAIINGTFRNGAGTPSGVTGTAGIQTGGKAGGATSLLQLDQRLLFANPASLNSSAVAANLTGTPLILSTQSASHLVKNVAANPMPLAAAQPLSAAVAQQTQQQQQAALLQQLATMPNGILATPGPFGLALPQTSSALAGGGNQFDLLALSGQFQSQPQQFDASSAQLSALLQQQQLAILQQQTNGGIAFGEYANAGADSGVILSSQRRFVGHSRQEANPYGLPTTGSKQHN